tara:strand:- start:4877 stop:6163 length:1287 start_codon:yes stop_codon:yes gene_type:complete
MGKGLIKTALSAYNLGWKAATPFLKLNHRLKDGWEQRTLSGGYPAHAHLWIQAASGGEAYLTWEVLKHLENKKNSTLRVLVTANTLQGFETLQRAADEINADRKGIAVQPRYFPFDAPDIMRQMMRHVRPEVALIMETEIWPGFLNACKEFGVKTLLANGRMSTKSLGGYLSWPSLFRELGPNRIMAISETDGRRFGTLFGRDRVWVMPNIKFDRMAGAGPMQRKDNPLASFIPEDMNFIVLGSVRKEEMTPVKKIAAALVRHRTKTVVGLFPRHMHHVPLWSKALDSVGLTWSLRSTMTAPPRPGTAILWDTFGELVPAYGLADTAFVGGSLAPLGGQNFLEPLTCGVTPVIGPHWSNFTWIGQDIFDSGLARMGEDAEHVLNLLIEILDEDVPRKEIYAKANAYIKDRTGGAKAVSKQVAEFLNNV